MYAVIVWGTVSWEWSPRYCCLPLILAFSIAERLAHDEDKCVYLASEDTGKMEHHYRP